MKLKFLRLALVILTSAVAAWAQTGAGTIQGTVKDPSGAAVPGASVTLVQTQTGLHYNTTTNSAGFYVFPSKPLGPYALSVEAPGMAKWRTEFTLQVGQTAQVDTTMKVGSTTTQVTVAANVTPLVNTTDATLSNIVEHTRIEQLPLNGRRVDTLVYNTTPGVTYYRGTNSVPAVNGIIYGSQTTQDGALLENRDWQRLPDRLPGLDTIEEFSVDTSNASAKAERPGTITLTTRHGTNQLHGSVFETNRDNAYGVSRARQDFFTKAPHLVRNEFGGSVGGPVDLPKIYNGKDKTFFFFSYEGFRLRQATTGAATVPTAAMRNGDFSGLVNGSGQTLTLYNPFSTSPTTPWTRTAFPNNQIPSNLESPLAKYLYGVTPMPTLANVNPLVDNNWYGLGSQTQNQKTLTLRLDHQISQRDQTFLRFTHGTNVDTRFNNGINGSTWPSTSDGFFNVYAPSGHTDDGVVSWTHTYSPSFFGETLFTYSRDYHIEAPSTLANSAVNVAAKLGLPNPINSPEPPPILNAGMPNYDYNSGAYLNIARSSLWDITENMTKTVGKHELQFGGTLQWEHDYTLPDQQYSSGLESFDSLATALYDPTSGSAFTPLPLTGSGAANLYLGVATYQSYVNRNAYLNYVSEKALYFQDNYKVTPRLTLNLGVRWEYNSPANLSDNSLTGFNPATHAVVLQTSIDNLARLGDVVPQIAADYAALGVKYESPAQAGLPQNLVYANKHDFGPRLGFAYRLTSGQHFSVLRGGFGRYYYPDSLRLWNGDNQFSVPVSGTLLNNPNLGSQSPDGNPNYLLRSVPTIIAGQNSQNAISLDQAVGISPGTGYVAWVDPHSPTSHADMWNLTYEKQLSAGTGLSLTYVGTHGANMPQYYSINDVPSNFAWFMNTGQTLPGASYNEQPFDQVFGQIQQYRKTGWSNDNSFQVELQHQYSKGYAFQVFYVLSNAFRAAGDGWRGNYVWSPNLFLPGMLPSDYQAADRYLNYQRDTSLPKHQIKWNWVANLPFGRGKLLGRNSGGFVNALIGGWQVAGEGTWYSRYFNLPTGFYGPFNGVQDYGNGKSVQDCRSGQCINGTLWWNGYIPANKVNQPNGVQGLPSNYTPFQTPLIPIPAGGASPNDPLAPYYDSNTVCVNLAAKTYQTLAVGSPCLSGAAGYQLTSAQLDIPWPQNRWNPASSNHYFRGPREWNMDASLFKEFPIHEQVRLRFNMDFFNVFNRPGTTMPNSLGIVTHQFSDNLPRVMQLTLRLTW